MGKQTEAERLTALFKARSEERDPANRFSYAKAEEMLVKYQLDDKYLLSKEQLWEILAFARFGAKWDERDRCIRVCEWNAENAFSSVTRGVYLALADELEEAYEP